MNNLSVLRFVPGSVISRMPMVAGENPICVKYAWVSRFVLLLMMRWPCVV